MIGGMVKVCIITDCPYAFCDGTGWVEQGQFDESDIQKCLCKIDEETNALVDAVLGK